MGFKLGNKPYERNVKDRGVQLNINVISKDLPKDVHGEAIDDNTIAVNDDIPKGSKLYKKVVAHEKHHADEMKSGKIAYGDSWVRDGNNTYHRKNGKIKYNGKWHEEGDHSLPWERRAQQAEKSV
tara:strand:- start:575 stop:949 length:375 start_codon:yes stop_codon:yes gene_type:complete